MAIIKYVIADDHKIFRQGLKLALMDDHKIRCIGEAATGIEVLEMIQMQMPDVILLDIRMPEMDGADAIKRIRVLSSNVKVIVITMFDDEQFIIRMMEAGANGYLVKDAEPDEIKMAIHTVYENEYYFNDRISMVMLRTLIKKENQQAIPTAELKFNDRELQVLKLICEEYTATEIANQMFLSPRTVEGLKSNLISKIGARNTAGLIVYAIRNGIHE